MKEYKMEKHMKTWNSGERIRKTCTFLKISVSLLPHWPRNSQGENGTCPIITPAMDNCDSKNKTFNFTWMVPLSTKSVPVF